MKCALVGLICCWFAASPVEAVPQPGKADGIATLLHRLEAAIESGQVSRYLALLSSSADRERAEIFAAAIAASRITRAIVRECDRTPLFGTLPGDGYQLLVEVFAEDGSRGRLATWRLDVRRLGTSLGDAAAADAWGISGQDIMTSLLGLQRLTLNPQRQFTARNFVVVSEDLQLSLAEGSVFVAEAAGTPTALVLMGRGDMVFRPAPETERGQVKILAGAEVLQTPFDAAYLRAAAFDLDAFFSEGTLVERPVDPREFKRADDVFRVEVTKSFVLDLSDLTSDIWSLPPARGDLLAEVHTKRFDTLTYALSHNEPEDVTVFDRRRQHNIALYPSAAKRAQMAGGYSEDDLAAYDVLEYDINATYTPDRAWLSGRTRMKVRVREPMVTSLTIRLADTLGVESVVAEEYGRLLSVRVRNQNSVVVNLPGAVSKGVELTLIVSYAGRLVPQPTDREILALDGQQTFYQPEEVQLPVEQTYMFSNRSYWYAQSTTTDYATAIMKLTVPAGLLCVASGSLLSSVPVAAEAGDRAAPQLRLRTYTFSADQPVRYLSWLITRLVAVRAHTVRMGEPLFGKPMDRPPGVFHDTLALNVLAQPRQQGRARQISDRAVDVLRFYTSIIGDYPYSSLMLAVVESELPGGHSPAYMTLINQPAVATQKVWRNDPASFEDFPEFFIAHEIAHQWWGQAVGWKNYHEQWLSEGFAQYFAALYAEHARGRPVFDSVIRRMQHWAMEESDQGPVWLGYRIGHIKGESRLFRAVVYNKSAVVLHMLRRLIGDEAFFHGIRRFYLAWRFRKAGTLDLQRAFEAEAGVPLGRFFDRWILGSAVPHVKVTSHTEDGAQGDEAIVRFEQVGEVFDLPVTVTLDYLDRPPTNVVVKLKDQVQEARIPVRGTLRKIDINRDEAAIADFVR